MFYFFHLDRMNDQIKSLISKREKERKDNEHMIIYRHYLEEFISDLNSLTPPAEESKAGSDWNIEFEEILDLVGRLNAQICGTIKSKMLRMLSKHWKLFEKYLPTSQSTEWGKECKRHDYVKMYCKVCCKCWKIKLQWE